MAKHIVVLRRVQTTRIELDLDHTPKRDEPFDVPDELIDAAEWTEVDMELESVTPAPWLDGLPERRPYWNHDCADCTYLYTVRTKDGERRDVYVSDHSPLKSVIIRHGSDGPEYGSYPFSVLETIRHLPPADFVNDIAVGAYEQWIRGDFEGSK